MSATLLSTIDLFGTPIQMNFNRKHKTKSHLGGFCTIVFFIIIIFAVINASKELFAKKNPKTITSDHYQNDPEEITLSLENLPISFGVQTPSNLKTVPFMNASIFKLEVQHVQLIRTRLSNGTLQEDYTVTEIATEPCKAEYFGELASEFADLALDTVYCIAKNQPYMKEIKLQGAYSSSKSKFLSVQVSACRNTTLPYTCGTPEEIDAYLAGGWFNILYGNTAIDPKNITRPDSRYKDVISTMISPANYKELEFEVSRVEVSSDMGWLVEDIETKSYQRAGRLQENLQFQEDPDGILIRCSVTASKLQTYYSRVYKKIQDVLAEIAGLFNIAFVGAVILTTHYARLKFKETVMNELFCIKTQPEPDDAATRMGMRRRRRSNLSKIGVEPRGQRPSVISLIPPTDTNASRSRPKRKQPPAEEAVKQHIEIPLTSSIHINDPMKDLKERRLASLKKNNTLFKELVTLKSPAEHDFSKRQSIISVGSSMRKVSQNFLNDGNPAKDSLTLAKKASNSMKDLDANEEIKLIKTRRSSTLRPFDLSLKMINEAESQKHVVFTLENALEKADEENGIKKKSSEEQEEQQNVEQNEKENEGSSSSEQEQEQEKEEEPKNEEEQFDREMEAIFSDQELLQHIGVGVEQERINLTVWEYISSFFYQTEEVRKKMKLLKQGIRKIDERLNVVNILKKLREVDKLKALLLAPDEFVLFNNLPKPEISLHSVNTRRSSFSMTILRRPTFIHDDTTDQILKAHKRLRRKSEKTAIEERILQIFGDKD